MSSFSSPFIRRPVATIMLNAALLVFGLLGLQRLPVRELPDIDPPIVNVLTVYPGASAEVVETEVTEILEEVIAGVEQIKLLSSTSREQVSSIAVEFNQGRDIDLAAQDVRDQVSRVRGSLPDDIDEPVVSKQDANAQPIIWVAFYSSRHNTRELTQIAEDEVKDYLQTVPGVSSVVIGGAKRKAIRIWLDPQAMAAHRIALADVESALNNRNVELPSGRIENRDREFTIQTYGELKTPEAFNRMILRREGARVVRLKDVGRAEEGEEDNRAVARFVRKPSVGLGIVRQSRANTLTVAKGVKARMEEIAPRLPAGIEFQYPYDQSVFVELAVKEVWRTLAVAFGLVVLTIFVFLRSLRSTLVPAMAIPISIGATFGLLYLLGYSINIFTLLALVLAIGLVVDDAIVVLENIHRHIEEGMPPRRAAEQAMEEISFAVIATTLSLVAVFLPLAFIGGVTGRLLLEFAAALACAVIVSSIVALTLSPMAGARILRPLQGVKHGGVYHFFERRLDRVQERYEALLAWSLGHRKTILFIALLSLGASYLIYSQLEREFLPSEDKGRLLSMALTPQGSTPEFTDRMVQQIEAILAEEPAVQSFFSAVALPFNGPGDAALGFTFIRLVEGDRKHIHDVVNGPNGLGARFFGEVEGAFAIPIMPKAVDLGFNQPYQLVLKHPDLEQLNAFVVELSGKLNASGWLMNARSTFELNKPEVRVSIDRDRAGLLDVSIREIARTLQVLFGGDDLGDIKIGGKQYDVIVQLEREQRLTPGKLEGLYVRNAGGDLVQLANLVTLETATGPNQIERFERQRSANLEATPLGIPLGTAVERTEALLAEILPPDFDYTWAGEARDLSESNRDIAIFFVLAVLVVYMVLAAQFESFVHPFTVMLSLPLAFLGAFALLYGLGWVNIAGTMLHGWANYAPDAPAIVHGLSRVIPRIPSMNLNIFSQVGLILLIGLVTKNSILLVEFANQEMARGRTAVEAMTSAGAIRLRPILMTSLATIMGILPIAIGWGEAAESRRPLGVVAVGGMITSTLLTLLVIPVVYTLFAEWTHRRRVVGSEHPTSDIEHRTSKEDRADLA